MGSGSESDYNPSSDSDLDDPDSVEVPGGGKSLKELQAANNNTKTAEVKVEEETRVVERLANHKVAIPTQGIAQLLQDISTNVTSTPGSSTSTLLANAGVDTRRDASGQYQFTVFDYFRLLLPENFFTQLVHQMSKGEITLEEIQRVWMISTDQNMSHVLLTLVKNQTEPHNPAYSVSGLLSPFMASPPIVVPRMSPAQLFKYYNLLLNDYQRNLLWTRTVERVRNNTYISQPRYRPSIETLWGSAPTKHLAPEPEHQLEEYEEQDDDEMIVAETYADYKPAKLDYGKKHPDPIVETASLASVLPPSCYYKLSLPDSIIKTGLLSALQLESIVYASQQHEHFLPNGERAGFLIGDGAGVGKGRTIAGIIYENFLCKRKKSIWITVSNDLVYDSERDLSDIGASKIKLNQMSKQKYGKIEGFNEGVLFVTYSGLIGEAAKGKNNTRLKQILQWCGNKFDGVIVFDECHRAKNLCPTQGKSTKTGEAVRDIQAQLPKARVIYASATGASEPRHMAYMTRLGLWGKSTPFPTVLDFVKSVDQRGVGAMEIVAMDMKLRGAYIARQLSFQGVKFSVVEVSLPPGFEETYDMSVKFWVSAMNKFIEGMVLMNCEKKQKRSVWTNFWGAHQRFFKYLCIASKVKYTIETARDAVKDGKCVVIGLQTTGEARTIEQLERDEGELTEFVSTAKGVLQHLVEKFFPSPNFGKSDSKPGTSNMFQNLMDEMFKDEEPGPSHSEKRKPVRKAAQKQNFKKLGQSSDDDTSEEHSEFEVSGSESEESESSISDFTSPSESESSEAEMRDRGPCAFGDGWKQKKNGAKRKKNPPKGTNRKAKGARLTKDEAPSSTPRVSKEAKAMVEKIRVDLLKEIENLGERLPPNTLDQLIDELGGPTEVAEMTGRRGRVIQDEQGSVSYESRAEIDVSMETINLKEKERFMKGEKLIAILSEAASSGISLQSDKRVANQRKRVHITLELPWSADRAVQQFGRTHRSNQTHPPEYVFLISNMAGEYRFASIVAKRLESLGALTHGDRRATESRDLSRYNIDNKFGRVALNTVMKAIMELEPPLVKPPPGYPSQRMFFSEVATALVGVGLVINSPNFPGQTVLDKDATNMTKFLNRILGMPIKTQNALFQYFTDTLAQIVKRAKRLGRYDLGILDLAGGELKDVTHVEAHSYNRKHATGTGIIELHKIVVNRGMSWEDAETRLQDLNGEHEGFYLATKDIDGRRQCLLAAHDVVLGTQNRRKDMYIIYRPHIGLQPSREYLSSLQSKYEKVTPEVAKESWEAQYVSSNSLCSHLYWGRTCKNNLIGNDCQIGIRRRTMHVLSGSVLLVWTEVERILVDSAPNADVKIQVVRVRGSNFKIIGLLVPNTSVTALKKCLEGEGSLSATAIKQYNQLLKNENSSDDEDEFGCY